MKVCVFIDGANFYYGLRGINKRYSDLKFDFSQYVTSLIGKEEILVKVFYYNAPLKNLKNKSVLYSRQQSFFKRLRNIPKFKVILCRRGRRVNDSGEEFHIIKGDDIHLAIDIAKVVYENVCDKVILISGDGDFEPAIRLVKEKGKVINICYFKDNISKNIFNISNNNFLIDKKICNKYFYRNKK